VYKHNAKYPYHKFSTSSLNLQGRAMAQVIRWRPIKAEICARSKASMCVIFGRQRHNGTGISPSTSVFPFQYYSIEAQTLFLLPVL